MIEQIFDALVELHLVGAHTVLVDTDAAVLRGGLDDDRPAERILGDRILVFDHEELRGRQAGTGNAERNPASPFTRSAESGNGG